MACFAPPSVFAVPSLARFHSGGLTRFLPCGRAAATRRSFARLAVKGTDKTERQEPQNTSMKTHKNSRTATTREGHLSKSDSERAVPTTNTTKKYDVCLRLEQISLFWLTIEATSQAEAIKKAQALDSTVSQDWELVEEETHVDSVEPLEGGQDNE